jgi:hypothetical protein
MLLFVLCFVAPAAGGGFGSREGDAMELQENGSSRMSPLARITKMKADRAKMISESKLPSNKSNLSPELHALLTSHSTKSNEVILAMTNAGEVDFALNMACSLKDVDAFQHLVVVATDDAAKRVLETKGVPVYFDPSIAAFVRASNKHKDADKFGGKTWSLIAVQKLLMIAAVVEAGFNVFFTDVDVVFMRNPLPHLACGEEHPHAKFMWDGPSLNLSSGIYREGVKPHYGEPLLFPHEVNGGFMLVCNNEHTVPMLADAASSFADYWEKGQCLYEWWCHDQV